MKKIKASKLSLNVETIKQLNEPQMRQAAGGVTAYCGTGACPTGWATCATCFCTEFTQYPCASGQRGCESYTC